FYFSASIESKISMEKPEFYYKNNVINALNFLEILLKFSAQTYFIFSSTAAIYQSFDKLIDEDHVKKPENVYGKTKLFIENVLEYYGKIHGLKYAILRYFNACGADMQFNLGENRKFETHLIPLLMRSMVRGDIDFYIYGNDYNTKDGTCIRDFVHVKDIALAHLAMLNYLQKNPASHYYFNIGTASGYSVLEIVNKATEITKINFAIKYKTRRAGDPDCLVASNQKIKDELGWQPQFSLLENIIQSAWEFEKFLRG
ncbi:MAG: UDP-glucose 4-epimerase GalE, partial [Alphaproteobacteria bacterium]